MAVVTDVLQTRLELLGLGQYTSGMEDVAQAFGFAEKQASKLALRFAAISVATGAGALAGMKFLIDSARMAGDEAAQFARASGNFKGQFPEDELAAFTADLEKVTGVADDVSADFIGLLGTFKLTADQAKQLAMPILNASEALKAQGVTTEQLAVQIGKALQGGNAQALRRSGIFVDEARFKVDRLGAVLEALEQQGGDAAIKFRNSVPGAMLAATNAMNNFREEIGVPLIHGLRTAAEVVVHLVRGFKELPGPVKTVITFVGVGLVGALTLASIATAFMAARTVWLAKAHLQAAAAARKQAEEEGKLAAVNTVGGAAAGGNAAGQAAKKGGGLLGRAGGAVGGILSRFALPLSIIAAAVGLAHEGNNIRDRKQGKEPVGFLETLAHIPDIFGFGKDELPAATKEEMAKIREENPLLAEAKRTNDLLKDQNDIIADGGFAGADFAPIGIQRWVTRSARG